MTREELLQSAKPIIFSTDMVQAILDGHKTQTRRVIKPQPTEDENFEIYENPLKIYADKIKWIKSPYRSGDILYVRETWQKGYRGMTDDGEDDYVFIYKVGFNGILDGIKWRPSIYMPKEAARLFLRVTNVRAERVQDITAEDCTAEGVYIISVSPSDDPDRILDGTGEPCDEILLLCYSELWNDLNAKRDGGRYSWNANPWVWVIQFEKLPVTFPL